MHFRLLIILKTILPLASRDGHTFVQPIKTVPKGRRVKRVGVSAYLPDSVAITLDLGLHFVLACYAFSSPSHLFAEPLLRDRLVHNSFCLFVLCTSAAYLRSLRLQRSVKNMSAALATPSSPAVASPTVGPRPLQLLESNISTGPASPSVLSPRPASSLGLSTPPPSARSFKSPNPRRQSSISYFPSDHVDLRSPTITSKDKTSTRRTNSMGIWTVEGVPGLTKGDRRSLGSLTRDATPPMSPGPSTDYGPLTLTEKCVSFA